MQTFALAGLLAVVGLTSCDERGPDGSRISDPTVEAGMRNSHLTYKLTYSVRRSDVHSKGNMAYLQDLASDAVANHDQVGEYEVIFLDEGTSQILSQSAFEVESDLMSQKTIRRLN